MSDTNKPRDGRLVASAALIGLIVVAGIIVVVLRLAGGGDDTEADGDNRTTASPTASPSPGASEGTSSTCGLPTGSQEIPTSAPETEWYLNGTIVAPKGAAYGPKDDGGGIHSCFAQSPVGAVFAAANAAADVANRDVDKRKFLETRAARTAGYEQALATVDSTPPSDGGGIQFSGFRVDASSDAAATVQLVVSSSEGPTAGQFVAITYNLQWVDGDWRVVIPLDGVPVSASITSLDGYIPWSGA
jgi:hypothetical protein